jgi:hypothetical protein
LSEKFAFPAADRQKQIPISKRQYRLIKNVLYPNAATLFINCLLSKDGQTAFSRALGQPTRRLDVDTQWSKEFGHVSTKEAT